jgi:cilia- and flagella-associated protein 57
MTVDFSFAPVTPEADSAAKIRYLSQQFHTDEITGLDICLRKQLVVTVSKRLINIWNYATKKLEISHPCQATEEATAAAFHPSGF